MGNFSELILFTIHFRGHSLTNHNRLYSLQYNPNCIGRRRRLRIRRCNRLHTHWHNFCMCPCSRSNIPDKRIRSLQRMRYRNP